MQTETPTITFLGATETVTGSRYLVEAHGARVLVDCGLFQGIKRLRERNWKAPTFDPASIDAVILTHAHIDHSGYIPRLCELGFQGPIYCTHGTRDLLQILLPDSGYLQEEQARRANKHGYTRHEPALPLYTVEHAKASLEQISGVPFHETFSPAPSIEATFSRAGHIVGSACLALRLGNTTISFTGDVGRPGDPIMKPAEPLGPTDYLVTESTYGDRLHPTEDPLLVFERIVNETAAKKGVVVVPAFAVGRSQQLLRMVAKLKAEKRIPDLPTFLDSPMAINATEIFRAHKVDHRLSDAETAQMCDAAKYSRTKEDSIAIGQRRGPMIVIAASGMATGGRILHHLSHYVSDDRNTVVIVGYQAAGTRGRTMLDGVDDLKIFGMQWPVRARVELIQTLSAHADYKELIDWFEAGSLAPKKVFVTHGEPSQSDAFRRRLKDKFGWMAIVPEDGARWRLE